MRRLVGLVAALLVAFVMQVGSPQSAGASGALVVTTTDDGADGECVDDCTLREAFQVINAAGSGSWEVRLPAGTYRLLDQSSGPEFADALRVPSLSWVTVVGDEATIDLEGWNGGVTPDLDHPSESVQRLFQLGNEEDFFSAHLDLVGLSITNLGDAPLLSRETTRAWMVYSGKPNLSTYLYAYSGVSLDHVDITGSGEPDALTSGIANVSAPKSVVWFRDSRVSHLGYGSSILPNSGFGHATASASRIYIDRSSFDHVHHFDGREVLNLVNSEIMDPIHVVPTTTGQNVTGPGMIAVASNYRTVFVVQSVVGFRSFTVDNVPCVPFYPFPCVKAAMPGLFLNANGFGGYGGMPGSLRIESSTVINPFTALVLDASGHMPSVIKNVTVTMTGESDEVLNALILDSGNPTVNVAHLTSTDRGGPLLAGPIRIGSSILDVPSTGEPVCSGPLGLPTSLGYNVIADSSCGAQSTDVVGVSNPLQPLGGYGGPTPTRPPVAGSVAVDLIPAASCTLPVDQRGISRPQGGRCDAGAVELQARWTTDGEPYPGPGGGLG